jgi:Cu(I)/Ag(I) efflux system membrane fusion protein
MKKNLMAIIAVVAIILGSLFLLKSGPMKNPKSATQPQPDAHQVQTPAPPQGENKQETEQETPVIEIPAEKQQMIGVKTVEVSVRSLKKVIRTVGLIEYDERRLATVNTKFEGWVEKLYVDYNGKYVKKGEPLADMYSPELVATQQEYINLLKWAKKENALQPPLHDREGRGEKGTASLSDMLSDDTKVMIEAAKQRLRLWDINDDQINRIGESGKPIRTLTLYSPVNGYVVQKAALQGMKVMPGEKLFDIADLSELWVVADIYESELAMVKQGERARITLSYFPDKEFSSRIDYIYPSISGTTRAAKVRFEIPNYGGRLKPQMYTNIEVKIDLGRKLSIPDDAVIDTGTRQIVYVDKGEGNFEPREVMLGMRSEGMREVIRGLKAGEKVAASATFLIDSESQLKNVTPLEGHKH